MTKPTVPDKLMPSDLLCYAPQDLAHESKDLIGRCKEIHQTKRWPAIDQVARGAKQLVNIGVEKCERAIVLVHLADTYFVADMYEPALAWYGEAYSIFSTLCEEKQRQNQAAAAYGLGLVHHAAGDTWEARRSYNETLELLDELKIYWAKDAKEARVSQCQGLCEQIEALKGFLFDSFAGDGGDRGRAAEGALGSPFPVLLGTVPKHNTLDVPIDTPIVLAFDRPMRADGLGVEIQPQGRLGRLPKAQWWEDDTIAIIRLTGGLLDYDTQYEITVAAARDRDGGLLEAGQIPMSFRFSTQAPPASRPHLLDALGVGSLVARDAPLVLIFSEEMDPKSLAPVRSGVRLVEPDPGNVEPEWDDGYRVLIIEHHPFPDPPTAAAFPTGTPGQWYFPRVNLAGIRSRAGDPLAYAVPLPFRPFGDIPGRRDPPSVIDHWPQRNARGIPVDLPFVILFSKRMDRVACEITPKPPAAEAVWHASRKVLVIDHTNLLYEQEYQITVRGQDGDGQDLPALTWSFRTRSVPLPSNPILGTTPADGIKGVPVQAKPLVVFTRPVSTASADFQWRPRDSSCQVSWDAHPTARIAMIHPRSGLIKGERQYRWNIDKVCDAGGANLLPAGVSHSWSFETGPSVATPPRITNVEPTRGLLDVEVDQDIKIAFSEPMDPLSLDVEIVPRPAHMAVEWDRSGREATIRHAGFEPSQAYRVLIRRASGHSGLPLDMDPEGVALSFTTQALEEPTVCYAYPRNGDVNVPLNAFLYVVFSESMETFECAVQRVSDVAVTPPTGVTGKPQTGGPVPHQASGSVRRRRWNADKTVLYVELAELEQDTDYEIKVSGAKTLGSGELDARKLSPINPWRFRTAREPWRKGRIGTTDRVFVGLLFLLVLAFGSIGLAELGGWWLAVGFAVAFPVAVFLMPGILHRLGVLFSLAPHEQAVVQHASDLVVVRGPASYVWRVPVIEGLRAIVPTRPFGLGPQSCRVPDADEGSTEISFALEYRVFGGLAAYQLFLDNCDKKEKEAKVHSSEHLRPVWEKRLGQLAKAVVSDSLSNMSEREIKNRRQTIEREVTLLLNQTTHRWGIEILDLKFVEIKPAEEV